MTVLRRKQVQDQVRRRPEWKAAAEVAARLAAVLQPRWPHDATKFLRLEEWLDTNVKRAIKLRLHESRGLRILDIGSGTGMFLFVCETLGHTAVGFDRAPADLESPETEIYTEMPNAFGVRVIRGDVHAYESLALNDKFDLITSFMVCFNNHKLPNEWGLGEWEFFTNDMLSMLNSGGRLALRLNHNEPRFGPRGYLDRETNDYFARLGSINDGEILIETTSP